MPEYGCELLHARLLDRALGGASASILTVISSHLLFVSSLIDEEYADLSDELIAKQSLTPDDTTDKISHTTPLLPIF